ncbi:MAG: 50S ribosomal protein L11 methyltransferase [Bacteroidota bacterium]
MDTDKDSSTYITRQTYLALAFSLTPAIQETAMALLMSLGYEGFEETDDGFNAYIPKEAFREAAIKETLAIFDPQSWSYTSEEIAPTNWNAVWEESYPAVYIEGFCQIVSSFHEQKDDFQHTIWIDPKMSFGTGHHATTRLMVRHLQEMAVDGLRVLDMGCGTGILGILAAKMNAKEVIGIDIDPWSHENGLENILRNEIGDKMEILLGDVSKIPAPSFQVILANINRHVLLADIPRYVECLVDDGSLVISGFFPSDEAVIMPVAEAAGLQKISQKQEGDWSSIRFQKV